MSANLSKMLSKPEKEVAQFIAQMEDKYCYPSHDVRLVDEVGQTVKQKISTLGLDPNDTTSEELYHGLGAKFDCDAALVDRALGINASSDFDSRLARAIEITSRAIGEREAWALKPSVAKKLLRDQPPKKMARLLHYRSVESMLKREDIGQLYLLLPQIESKAYQNSLAKVAAHLPSSDWSLQPINFIRLPAGKIDVVAEPPDLNVCNKLTASVALWPAKNLANAPVITLALMLVQGVQELGAPVPVKSLLSVHPALAWWSNMEHLVSLHGEIPISLNIHDVAHNHQNGMAHELSSSAHAAKALWDELTGRYQALNDQAVQTIQNETTNLIPTELATEYQEA